MFLKKGISDVFPDREEAMREKASYWKQKWGPEFQQHWETLDIDKILAELATFYGEVSELHIYEGAAAAGHVHRHPDKMYLGTRIMGISKTVGPQADRFAPEVWELEYAPWTQPSFRSAYRYEPLGSLLRISLYQGPIQKPRTILDPTILEDLLTDDTEGQLEYRILIEKGQAVDRIPRDEFSPPMAATAVGKEEEHFELGRIPEEYQGIALRKWVFR